MSQSSASSASRSPSPAPALKAEAWHLDDGAIEMLDALLLDDDNEPITLPAKRGKSPAKEKTPQEKEAARLARNEASRISKQKDREELKQYRENAVAIQLRLDKFDRLQRVLNVYVSKFGKPSGKIFTKEELALIKMK